MPKETISWRGIEIEILHDRAPINRSLHRFSVIEVRPSAAHLPLPTPRNGRCHYAPRDEIPVHGNFATYFIDRLERDATPGLIERNERVVKASRQLKLDF